MMGDQETSINKMNDNDRHEIKHTNRVETN